METNDKSATKLMLACKIKKTDESDEILDVLKLLKAGEVVNALDRYGSTPLMYAVMSDLAKSETNPNQGLIIDSLIKYGANVNVSNLKDETPLILAAKNGDPETLERLLNAGANNFDVRDKIGGKTVYEYATLENGCKQVLYKSKNNIPRSILTQILDVILYPFRLIGSVFKSIGATSNFPQYKDSTQTIAYTKLPSQDPEEEVKGSNKRYDSSKEKKPATMFSHSPDSNKLDQTKLPNDLRGIKRPTSPTKGDI